MSCAPDPDDGQLKEGQIVRGEGNRAGRVLFPGGGTDPAAQSYTSESGSPCS
ncbi:MAG: hypothetical protein JWQ81_2066 [Amycolatopsis sp.]|nr:hypothetical protein [Amycolatopsis sp.]